MPIASPGVLTTAGPTDTEPVAFRDAVPNRDAEVRERRVQPVVECIEALRTHDVRIALMTNGVRCE
jgi:hypothetical protein